MGVLLAPLLGAAPIEMGGAGEVGRGMGGPWRGCATRKFSRDSISFNFCRSWVTRALSSESKSMLKPLSHGVGVPVGVGDRGGTAAVDVHPASFCHNSDHPSTHRYQTPHGRRFSV
jgi:hypothetical protein